mmetsp:Transcript_103540/g.221435  ORF Transcript_103540/g.221435 Transcript_103540/m.221435 type:complete len:233 (+) Transcript_103540:269-967(+)
MGQHITASGLGTLDTATEFRSGRTEPNMKASGRTIVLVARGVLLMPTAMRTLASGKIMLRTGSASSLARMRLSTKGAGSTISRRAKEWSFIRRAQGTRASSIKEQRMVAASTVGRTARTTAALGVPICSTAMASIKERWGSTTKACGRTRTSPGSACTHGPMVALIVGNTLRISRMVSARSRGRMATCTKDTSRRGAHMELARVSVPMDSRSLRPGSTVFSKGESQARLSEL